jgi:hypothetical protein
LLFCIVNVGYSAASAVEWCIDNEDLDARNGCTSDKECLQHGRNSCDTDLYCFGIAWNTNNTKLKICRSTTMGPMAMDPGWRTMMKQGIYIVYW